MVYETEDIDSIPQVWAMYKEVMGYFADGMSVPDNGEYCFMVTMADSSD